MPERSRSAPLQIGIASFAKTGSFVSQPYRVIVVRDTTAARRRSRAGIAMLAKIGVGSMALAADPVMLETVLKFHRAWTSGHVDLALTLVTDDFTSEGPAGTFGKEAYREYLAGFVKRLTGIVDVAQFTSLNNAVLIYYPQTEMTDSTPAAELFTLRDGLIAKSLLMFDRLSYMPSNQ